MATTRQPRQFLAVWNDAGTEVKGSTFEESLFVDGAFWKNELTPVAPENFGEFGTMFSNQLQIQYDALVAEKATLLSEKATLAQEKATLESQVASLQSQVETLTSEKADLATEKSDLTATVATLTQEKNGLQSQVASVTAQVEAKAEQIETLTTEKAELTSSVSTLTQERSVLVSQVNGLTTQLATATSQVEGLTTQTTTLTASLSAANARIANLLQEIPFNPREINVDSFKARLFRVLETEDVVRMYAAESDLVLKQIAATIANWDAAYPIRLDSEELQTPLGYLVHIDLLTPDEVVSLRRDATRAEAYFAPEE